MATALITGSARGIGAAVAKKLAANGAYVYVNYNGSAARADEVVNEIVSAGGRAEAIQCDVADFDKCKEMIDKIIADKGRIDILVNNAVDRRNMTSLATATRQKLQDSASVNLNGQIMLSQAVLRYMIRDDHGSIIFISSMRGLDCPHFPFYPLSMQEQPVNYTTEKWAMVGLTKYMAGRYGRHHIRVNCIAPGGYNPELENEPDKKKFIETYIENCPLGCWANEDDIKGPVVFLASEASRYVTGATLVMDGGWTIW